MKTDPDSHSTADHTIKKNWLAKPNTQLSEHFFSSNGSNIVDILRAAPSDRSFSERVNQLCLSQKLEEKILRRHAAGFGNRLDERDYLTEMEEKELATEVLLSRHKFTCLVFENRKFKQAAITIIQNIYLFRQRKIFFGTTDKTGEEERQEALILFSQSPENASIPLAKSFQHLILARVWDRIINQANESFLESQPFKELHEIVEQLNTLRNIYMLLSISLVHKLTRQISAVYKQSITMEDASQIGSFGIARAAYRYHPSTGLRFSTYAARWIQKEIQRQSLEGRLIRISANLVEQLARAAREGDIREQEEIYDKLLRATAQISLGEENSPIASSASTEKNPQITAEHRDIAAKLLTAIETLPVKSRDIILRRYGLGPYLGKEQSVIEISKVYGVTRSSIYQLEQTALKKLKNLLPSCDPS